MAKLPKKAVELQPELYIKLDKLADFERRPKTKELEFLVDRRLEELGLIRAAEVRTK